MNKVDLKEVFMNLQQQMIIKLSANRKIICNPGTKGDASELNWLKMLEAYLPKRYSVDKASVLDSDGTCSDQLDIVIYDRQYSPFLFNQDGAKYIPAECVYAVFEVKQTISKEDVEYAGKKAKSVRKLKRTSASIPHAGGVFNPKSHFNIIAGILTLDSEWTPALGNSFEDAIGGLSEMERINLGCVLAHGSFEVYYDNGTALIGKSRCDDALIFFFLKLLSQLQKLGTVPAMDINDYAKVLN